MKRTELQRRTPLQRSAKSFASPSSVSSLTREKGLPRVSDRKKKLDREEKKIRAEVVGGPCAFPRCHRIGSTLQHCAGRVGLAEDGMTPRQTYRPWIVAACLFHNVEVEANADLDAEAKAVGFSLAINGDPYRDLDPQRSAEWVITPLVVAA